MEKEAARTNYPGSFGKLWIRGRVVGGHAGARTLLANFGWSTLVSPESVCMAFAFSVAIGVFFSYYPARKAAHLDPIEALRYE